MNAALIDNIAGAVLYEGYVLYPYRRSTKNHHRWTFGGVFPRDYGKATAGAEPHRVQTQCLLRGGDDMRISVCLRFLQVIDRTIEDRIGRRLDEIEVAGKRYRAWQEAGERCIAVEGLRPSDEPRRLPFAFESERTLEPLHDTGGTLVADLVRTRSAIRGMTNVSFASVGDGGHRLTVELENDTPLPDARNMTRDQAALHSMASTHLVLSATGGEFISLIDPPAPWKERARGCKNVGIWPVLVGEVGSTDCMLAAPIILYDYPQVAPESPGDLFDGTEIDEILSLRILTLTDDEKREAAELDPRGAAMLRRTQNLAREQLMRLHGTMRPPRTVQAIHVGSAELHIGDHVRLRPRQRGADAFDILLRGKSATITAIEQDYENRLHVAVTVDDDPGADIGAAGKIGHRFFFGVDEIEPIGTQQEAHA